MPTATNSRVEIIANGKFNDSILRNATVARLYQDSVLYDNGVITSAGGISTSSGEKTGRSPKDKRVIDQPSVKKDVWWGTVNIPMSEDSFQKLRELAIDFLDNCPRIYVLDGFAGWDTENRLSIRVICSRPYHALFMHNMLIRPNAEELANFGTPDYVIYNAGQQPADTTIDGVSNKASVSINFDAGEMVILGTEYAGEMKKGVFTIMNYLMPKKGVLSMHCSANEGPEGDVSLFFGLSGTGKTTLSTDPKRALIGDDEHCWNDKGVFNIEGGCYAKCIGLTREKEPQIFDAIRFGSVLENTIQDPVTQVVDYNDASLTENTRCSYPIEFISNAKTPCIGGHPQNIVFLTCDAFGVLPPVSRLTPAQAMYHFISGYTAKVAGTEMGVTEPEATFSACFGAAFLVWHPTKYAEQLAKKISEHGSSVWLINTGWSGGAYGTGSRISLKYTRAIINAIHDGSLQNVPFDTDPIFNVATPRFCNGVPADILTPRTTWVDPVAFETAARELVGKFHKNFEKYADVASAEIRNAAPVIN